MLIDSSKPKRKITEVLEVDSIIMDIDRAINIGLILNELVTNSIKHAFKYLDDPVIKLKIKKTEEEVWIAFADNGNNAEVDVESNSVGFGWELINSLVLSLGGQLDYSVNDGFAVDIKFPVESPD